MLKLGEPGRVVVRGIGGLLGVGAGRVGPASESREVGKLGLGVPGLLYF